VKVSEDDAKLAALAVNFSEQIFDSLEPSEDVHAALLMQALEKRGYEGLTMERVDQLISYFLTESEIDLYSLPEYEEELPLKLD
jgi:hypothetical protein|tara:strand:- start:812 stop:1063 length:252 start_codon:yes stop_codon:yes gene_type:complete